MAEIPNVVLGNEPHTDIITSAKRPNMWSLDRRPVKPGKGKKKRGSNLMDTGPDDNEGGGGAFGVPEESQVAAADRQALSQGIQTQGGVSPAVEQYEQALATGRQDINTGGAAPGSYGFRERPAGATETVYDVPSPEAPPAPADSQGSQGNLMDTGPDDNNERRILASAGGSGNIDRTGLAQQYGYQRGTGNIGGLGSILGMAAGIPFLGAAASKAEGFLPESTYGNYGTTDAMGNVFGPDGRAYDPITGRAVGSYGNTGDWKNAAVGGYQNLRGAGLNPVEAGLGSYENSIYNPAFGAPEGYVGDQAAYSRGARLRGGASAEHGLTSTAGIINENTFGTQAAPIGSLDAAAASGQGPALRDVSGEMLGFDNTRAFSADQASQNTGQWGTETGDLAATEFGPGVINESGQIEHGGGTVVALTDTSNPGGENISLLSDSTASQNRAREELERRAGQTPVRGPDQVIQEQRESGNDSGGGGGK